ncbi:hypothetical protein BJ742DRAFT_793285 [Cladochytrium replicatum]|nr:hypothetical protein BJ742DRAFT_793285 [Cladochytrium replicatum]
MLATSGPRGFFNAPATKGIFLCVAINTLSCTIFNLRSAFQLQLIPHITTHYQFWRFVSTHLAFSSSTEILFGGLLIYQFRLLERQWGTNKYFSFVVLTSALSTALQVATLGIGALVLTNHRRALGGATVMGPYGFVFAALYQYHKDIPVTYRMRTFGISWSDKAILYILSAQLLTASWPQSLLAGLCGLAAGALYKANFAKMKSWRIPKPIARFAQANIYPLLQSDNVRVPRGNSTTSMGGNRASEEVGGGIMAAAAASAAQRMRTMQPSEEHVSTLMAMGFEREAVVGALRAANNNVEQAATLLLESAS